jgi:hypothetical protein
MLFSKDGNRFGISKIAENTCSSALAPCVSSAMKFPMRVPILLAASVFTLTSARAETLSDADRETLLENLEKLRDAADGKVDARFRVALSAFRNAIGSDDAAIDLYLNCMEKVNFEEQHRKAADFREWRRKEAEKLSDPGLRLALRHQLRWLMITLQAASDKNNRAKFTGDVQEIVDAIMRDAEKMKNQEDLLGQSVIGSVFARAYDINSVKIEDWPLSPIQLDAIYDEILFPPLRRPARVSELRAAWIRRIQQESTRMEHWGGGKRGQDRENQRIGTVDALQSPEYTKFLEEDIPKLQWEMETDLFRSGDESGASVRMLAHLEKYIAHASAREWSDQFQRLLKPEVAVPTPPAPAETGAVVTP